MQQPVGAQYGNCGNLPSQFFDKNFVKATTYLVQNNAEVINAQCGRYGNLLSLFFGKYFVKVMVLPTELLDS